MDTLEVKNVCVSFQNGDDTIEIIHDISFSIEEHKTLALVGESGCGKTQTARCCLGLLAKNATLTSGHILWHGQDILAMNERELQQIRGKEIALIFQNPQVMLDPVFTIEKQLEECIKLRGKYSKKDVKKEIISLLQSVKIADVNHVMKSYPCHISQGMCQRVMIAMAVASKAHLWIMDEVTSALDVSVQADILQLLKHLQEERKLSMLLITHDLRLLSTMSDDVAIMLEGEIVEIVASDDLFKSEVTHHPYTHELQKAMHFIVENTKDSEETNTLEGCCYVSRCPKCVALCKMKKPEMKQISKTQKIRCHFC